MTKPSIEQVVLYYGIALKRLGNELCGQCPFHTQAGQLWVRPQKGEVQCVACGAEHDVLGFIQAMDGVDRAKAKRRLRGRMWAPKAAVVSYVVRVPRLRRKPPRKKRLRQVCGAKNRQGLPCRCKLLYRGGRCRYHGGLSTGPKTPDGRARSAQNLRLTPTWKKRNARIVA